MRSALLLALTAALMASAAPGLAETAKATTAHDHAHDQTEAEKQIYKGYFDDSQIQPRTLEDWQGDWQSVYPLLQDGTLDPVMAAKAETGDKTAQEYRAYYETGYRTDVDRITFEGDIATFHRGGAVASARYASDGFEVLTYEKGNRGVRYIFTKTEGDAEAPAVIQFSDHAIAPVKASHFHLYFGDDRAALLKNVTNWPTYYPASLTADDVVHEMLAH